MQGKDRPPAGICTKELSREQQLRDAGGIVDGPGADRAAGLDAEVVEMCAHHHRLGCQLAVRSRHEAHHVGRAQIASTRLVPEGERSWNLDRLEAAALGERLFLSKVAPRRSQERLGRGHIEREERRDLKA